MLMVVPFALALLIPASAAASDGLVAVGSADQRPSSDPVQPTEAPTPLDSPTTEAPAPSEPPPSEESPPSEEPLPTEEPPPSEASTGEDPGSVEPVIDAPTEPSEPQVPATSAGPETAAVALQAVADPEPKVTICHRTNDPTNPYNQLAVTISQAIGHAAEHNGPIFSPGGPRPWGDIIPPIPGLPGGQNWPEGRGILNNGCEVTPDPGPLPNATIGAVECVGALPSLEVTVSNDADATAPAIFNIFVDGALVQTVGPVAPGQTQTVTLTGAGLQARENQTFTVEVRSGGAVVASEVITVDCAPPPPGVEITAELSCGEGGAEGSLAVTNNGPDPVTVTVTVNGDPLGQPLVVGPGATEMGTGDLSQFEDQTVTVQVLVDGQVVATYQPMPDCELAPLPRVRVAGLECPPPSATATLSNAGDPESTVVFTILVNGRVVQQTAPLFGGDTTTIVGDLTPYEDQTVTIELRANGEVLGSRTIAVNCRRPADLDIAPAFGAGASGTRGAQPGTASNDVLPATGAGFSLVLVPAGLASLAVGILLTLAGRSPRRGRSSP